MIRAAGVLFVTPDARALFLKRSSTGDHADEWCLPGGKIENGETALQAAIREVQEECSLREMPQGGEISELCRRIAPNYNGDKVDFTTFMQRVPQEFSVKTDAESSGWCWAPVTAPPQPLHPGVQVALARYDADELQVAQMIRAGDLSSPQKFENVWLFALRVTGTGMAYRGEKTDDTGKVVSEAEYVWRDPSLYLNDHFLQRCNGLSVVADHPEGMLLDPEEFAERTVGTCILPYIQGEDVWSIAKIYEPQVAEFLANNPASTSPGVVFRDATNTNTRVTTEDGDVILIEGKPHLLDHLALCKRGVWDKQGPPTGVQAEGMNDMTDEEKKALRDKIYAEARKDAEEDLKKEEKEKREDARSEKIDALCDSVSNGMAAMADAIEDLKERMDALEDLGEGPEEEIGEVVGDKKRGRKDEDKGEAEHAESVGEKEAEDDEDEDKEKDKAKDDEDKGEAEHAEKVGEEKSRKDESDEDKDKGKVTKKDSVSALRAELDALKSKMPKSVSDDDYHAMAGAQAKADDVYSLFGKQAPRPLDGETLLGYRKRMISELKQHSPTFKEFDLSIINDSAALDPIEKVIINDAMVAGRSPATVPAGTLRQRRTKSESGHNVTEFIGEPRAWLSRFGHTKRRVRMFNHKAA